MLNFLVHTASLVAGAIENAQLYEETRRRVDALTTLTRLSQALAAVTLREDLHDAVTRGARELLGADACQIWRLDQEADELVLAAADPPERRGAEPAAGPGSAAARHACGASSATGALRPRAGSSTAASGCSPPRWPPGDEQLGLLCCAVRGRGFADEDGELLRAVANQTAVGLKKAELIERLTAENIVKDMFEALAAGSVETAEAKASEARCDLGRPHVFLHARARAGGPTGALAGAGRALQSRLRRLYRRAFFDARHDALRALVPLPALDKGATTSCCALVRGAGPGAGAQHRA